MDLQEIETRLEEIKARQKAIRNSGSALESNKLEQEKQRLLVRQRNLEAQAWRGRFYAPLVAAADSVAAELERKAQEKAEQQRQEVAALLKQTARAAHGGTDAEFEQDWPEISRDLMRQRAASAAQEHVQRHGTATPLQVAVVDMLNRRFGVR